LLLVEDGNHGESRPRRHEFSAEGETSFIRAADLKGGTVNFAEAERIDGTAMNRIRKGIGQPCDVLLSHKGTVGRVAFAPADAPPFVCSPQTTFYRSLDRSALSPRWLQYYLASPGFTRQLASRQGETSMADYVSLTEQRRLYIALPTPTVQNAITDVLSTLDDKIECNTQIARIAPRLAATLLQYQQPRKHVALAAVAEVRRGLSYTGAGLAQVGMPMVNLANAAVFGGFKRGGWKYYKGSYKPRHIAHGGDLMVANTDLTWKLEALGWPILLPDDVREALFSHHISIIDFSPEWVHLRLPLWAHLFSREARLRIEAMAHGTTVAALPPEALTGLEVPVVDADLPAIAHAEALLRRGWAAEGESEALARLRDALLPALMSGELRVRDAEEWIREVV